MELQIVDEPRDQKSEKERKIADDSATGCTEHEFKPNGVCARCVKHNDLPTLPLKIIQTPGGYKAIHDAEDRLVTFVGMREDDKAWGEFLIRPVNSYDSLRTAAQAAIKVLKIEFPGSIKRKEAIAQLEAALNPQQKQGASVLSTAMSGVRDD